VAIAFAAVAFPLGGMFAFDALDFYGRSLAAPTTRQERLFNQDARQDAARSMACSIVLIVPGFWYIYVGVGGEVLVTERPDR